MRRICNTTTIRSLRGHTYKAGNMISARGSIHNWKRLGRFISSSILPSVSQPWKSIPVKAYYVGNNIDVVKTTNNNSVYSGIYIYIYIYI